MKLTKEELLVGASVAAVWTPFLGLWCLLAIPAASVMWAIGGAGKLSVRRFGVPIIIVFCACACLQEGTPLISLLPFMAALHIGYGIPSFNGPGNTMDDKGSMLGRFWFKVLKTPTPPTEKQLRLVNIFTRCTFALAIGLSLFALGFVDSGFWSFGVLLLMLLIPTIVVNIK